MGVRRDDFTDQQWEQLRAIRRGARLQIMGVVGVSKTGMTTIWLDSFPLVQAYSFPETLSAIEPHRQRIGASLFVAHFRSLAEPTLVSMGYLPVDVRLLTTYWHGGENPYTLRALYSGFGEPMFLAPSPSPQLVEALIATGKDRVFTATSLFTSSYRGRTDGSEASIIMAKTLNCSLQQLVRDSRSLLSRVFGAVGVLETVGDPATWPELTSDWPTRFPVDEVQSAYVQVCRQVDAASSHTTELAKFIFPPTYVPLEAVTESTHNGVPLGTIILHLERILPLVQYLPIRRLHSIEPLFPPGTTDET